MEGIQVSHVYKAFGKEQVLQDISFDIPEGHIYGVVGNNGSGKTVLMKCICGFLRCDRGIIRVNGKRREGQAGNEDQRFTFAFFQDM